MGRKENVYIEEQAIKKEIQKENEPREANKIEKDRPSK